LLAHRAPMYAAAADFSIDSTVKTHTQVADELIEEARRRYPCG